MPLTEEIRQRIEDLDKQFGEFLKAKGITDPANDPIGVFLVSQEWESSLTLEDFEVWQNYADEWSREA